MFKKKQDKLAWVFHVVTNEADKFVVKQVGTSSEKLTLDEFEALTMQSVKTMFDRVRNENKNKDNQVGIFISPFLNIIDEQTMEQDENWQKAKEAILNLYE